MELDEYVQTRNDRYLMRVLNKKYWPHHVEIRDETGEAERWCYQYFKSSDWRNVGRYFAFKNGDEATMFSLRWAK